MYAANSVYATYDAQVYKLCCGRNSTICKYAHRSKIDAVQYTINNHISFFIFFHSFSFCFSSYQNPNLFFTGARRSNYYRHTNVHTTIYITMYITTPLWVYGDCAYVAEDAIFAISHIIRNHQIKFFYDSSIYPFCRHVISNYFRLVISSLAHYFSYRY